MGLNSYKKDQIDLKTNCGIKTPEGQTPEGQAPDKQTPKRQTLERQTPEGHTPFKTNSLKKTP